MTPRDLEAQPAQAVTESMAMQYFYTQTLPLLQAAQPSAVWDILFSTSIVSGAAFFKIAAASGLQHRFLRAQHSDSRDVVEASNVDALYGRALYSFRRYSMTNLGGNVLGMVVGCILMCNLESLRGSVGGLLVHLNCGIQSVLWQAGRGQEQNDSIDAAMWLLRRYCMSIELFSDLPSVYESLLRMTDLLPEPIARPSPVSATTDLNELRQSTMRTSRLFSFLCSSPARALW